MSQPCLERRLADHINNANICRLLIKASGAGEYWGEYEKVRCKVYFKGIPYQKDDDERTFLSVESVKMDFSVKDIEMGVENDNNNRVIRKLRNIWSLNSLQLEANELNDVRSFGLWNF